MRSRTRILQAIAIIVMSGWMLAEPTQAEASMTNCGRSFCVGSCSEGYTKCESCPGFVCQYPAAVPCGSAAYLICDSDM